MAWIDVGPRHVSVWDVDVEKENDDINYQTFISSRGFTQNI